MVAGTFDSFRSSSSINQAGMKRQISIEIPQGVDVNHFSRVMLDSAQANSSVTPKETYLLLHILSEIRSAVSGNTHCVITTYGGKVVGAVSFEHPFREKIVRTIENYAGVKLTSHSMPNEGAFRVQYPSGEIQEFVLTGVKIG